MIVNCGCGAKLRVGDYAAGKRTRCGRCAAVVPIQPAAVAVADHHPVVIRAPRSWEQERVVPAPWDVWILIALAGLNLAGNVVNMVTSRGMFVGAVILNVLVLKGLFDRAGWAWWLMMIGSVLSFFLSCWLLTTPKFLGVAVNPALVLAGLVQAIAQMGLLVSCRVRGTYYGLPKIFRDASQSPSE